MHEFEIVVAPHHPAYARITTRFASAADTSAEARFRYQLAHPNHQVLTCRAVVPWSTHKLLAVRDCTPSVDLRI
jgi:hypothetical protein